MELGEHHSHQELLYWFASQFGLFFSTLISTWVLVALKNQHYHGSKKLKNMDLMFGLLRLNLLFYRVYIFSADHECSVESYHLCGQPSYRHTRIRS